MSKWDESKISRGTKCFGSFHGTGCHGAFPKGFLKWLDKNGWLKSNRCHLCSGAIDDPGSYRVDIRPEMKPDLIYDATKTGLPNDKFDCVIVDPPYSKELADKLYGTSKYYYPVNKFLKEAIRICKPGGYVISLSYEIPRRVLGGNCIAVWGIYVMPTKQHMRALLVWRKEVLDE